MVQWTWPLSPRRNPRRGEAAARRRCVLDLLRHPVRRHSFNFLPALPHKVRFCCHPREQVPPALGLTTRPLHSLACPSLLGRPSPPRARLAELEAKRSSPLFQPHRAHTRLLRKSDTRHHHSSTRQVRL